MRNEPTPRGGLTPRKYSAIYLALGVARGALDSAIRGEDMERVKFIFEITATRHIARSIGCNETDLAISLDEHLSPEEINRIKGWESTDDPRT